MSFKLFGIGYALMHVNYSAKTLKNRNYWDNLLLLVVCSPASIMGVWGEFHYKK